VNREDLIRKLQKLRERANSGDDFECQAAQRMFDAIIDKYDIAETEIEEVKDWDCIEKNTDVYRFMQHVSASLGLVTGGYRRGKRKTNQWFVRCTKTEWEVFKDIYTNIKAMYNIRLRDELKRARVAAKSYVAGFVTQTYSVEDPNCPECNEKLGYNKEQHWWECPWCAYHGKKIKPVEVDHKAFATGRMESGRLIGSEIK